MFACLPHVFDHAICKLTHEYYLSNYQLHYKAQLTREHNQPEYPCEGPSLRSGAFRLTLLFTERLNS